MTSDFYDKLNDNPDQMLLQLAGLLLWITIGVSAFWWVSDASFFLKGQNLADLQADHARARSHLDADVPIPTQPSWLQGTVRGGLFDLEATPKRKPLYQTVGYQKPGDGCPPRLCYCDVSQFGF